MRVDHFQPKSPDDFNSLDNRVGLLLTERKKRRVKEHDSLLFIFSLYLKDES